MSRTVVFGIAGFLLATAAASNASAHHEVWILRDPGVQCAFATPLGDGSDHYYDGLYNWGSYSRWMSCPVSLSARWASSSPVYPSRVWGRASAAAIYVYNAQDGAVFSCQAQARVASGGLRWSRAVATATAGDQRLMPNFASDWGGSLEASKDEKLSSLEFSCQVPPNGSGVYGHKVRMCIRNAGCVVNGEFGEGGGSMTTGPLTDSVQTSGIACMASNNNNLVRSELGAKNVGDSHVSVICPISPPADDTNEVYNRLVRYVAVKYKAGPGWGEVPTCQLHARMRNWQDFNDHQTDNVVSNAFTQQEPGFEEVSLRNFSVGTGNDGSAMADIALSVHCDLPPGYTLQGITADIAIPPVSGGF
jgi:hypothetical protein